MSRPEKKSLITAVKFESNEHERDLIQRKNAYELLVYGSCEGLDSLEYIHYSSCSAIQLFCCDAQVSIDKCKIAVTAIEY